MNPSNSVTVFNFRTYPGHAERPELAPYKAPMNVIVAMGGEVIRGTEEEVPAEDLSDDGHYQRQATGWGDLNN